MEEENEFRASAGEASYATLAHVINAVCGPDPPVLRQYVYNWHVRRTLNKRGMAFPAPVREIPESERRQGQPSVFFATANVLEWYECGVTE